MKGRAYGDPTHGNQARLACTFGAGGRAMPLTQVAKMGAIAHIARSEGCPLCWRTVVLITPSSSLCLSPLSFPPNSLPIAPIHHPPTVHS